MPGNIRRRLSDAGCLTSLRAVASPEQEIHRIAADMEAVETKGELGVILAREVKRFSQYDLTVFFAWVRRDVVNVLPMPYREKFRPYADIWFFGTYHELQKYDRKGVWQQMQDPITDRETFVTYCRMVPDTCLRDDHGEIFLKESTAMDPFYLLLNYLLSAFSMFVRDIPGHPEGTPFPGGFAVHKKTAHITVPSGKRKRMSGIPSATSALHSRTRTISEKKNTDKKRQNGPKQAEQGDLRPRFRQAHSCLEKHTQKRIRYP